MEMLRLTPEQDAKLNKMLEAKFAPKFLVSGEVAGLIKTRIAQTIQKSGGNLSKEELTKVFSNLDTLRDSMTKTSGLKTPKS